MHPSEFGNVKQTKIIADRAGVSKGSQLVQNFLFYSIVFCDGFRHSEAKILFMPVATNSFISNLKLFFL
jgi:hypothetical protein